MRGGLRIDGDRKGRTVTRKIEVVFKRGSGSLPDKGWTFRKGGGGSEFDEVVPERGMMPIDEVVFWRLENDSMENQEMVLNGTLSLIEQSGTDDRCCLRCRAR